MNATKVSQKLMNEKAISEFSIIRCGREYAGRVLAKRRALPEVEQFQLAALFAAIIVCYLLILLTLREGSSVLATWPIFSICMLFAGFIGALAHVFGSIPWALLAGYLFLCFWLSVPPVARVAIALPLSLTSGFYICFTLWRYRSQSVNYVWLGCISSLTLFATSGLYSWADIMQRLPTGDVHQDTLFHAAIASMIKTYGVASTGLNGLVEINYHVFSHRLFAALSDLSGAPVLAVYGLAPYVLFVPILLFSLCYAATKVSGAQTIATATYSWSLGCILLVALPGLFYSWAVWDSFFVSESYLVALGTMCIALPSLARRTSSIAEVMFAGVVCSVASMSKGSVGLILAFLYIVKAVSYAQNRKLAWLAALTAALAFVVVSITVAASARSTTEFEFFHFVWEFTQKGRVLSLEWVRSDAPQASAIVQGAWLKVEFLAVHFLLSWIAIVKFLRIAGGNVFWSPGLMLNAGALAFSVASVVLLSLPAGAVYYFSSCAQFVAMPFVTSFASAWLIASASKTVLWFVPLAATIAVVAFGHNAIGEKFKPNSNELEPSLSQLVYRLESLRPADADKQIVFTPSPELIALNTMKRVSARPFLYPAVSERVWTGILSSLPDDLKAYQYYGYPDYLSSDGTEILPLINEDKALIKQRVDVDVKIVPLPAN